MSRRLYFLLPDVAAAQKVEEELLLARVEEKRMHFLAKRGTDMKTLPEAGPMQKTDLLRGIYIGLLSGAITGLLAGLYIYFTPDVVGMQAPPYVVFVCALVGAIVGAWISGPLIGGSTPNARLATFQESINNGMVLMIIDTASAKTEDVRKIVKAHYPDAEGLTTSDSVPAFQ